MIGRRKPPSGEITIRGLTRRFGEKLAVRPVNATIGPGGVTGLLGPNGSGKSTLLRMLLGLVRPDDGEATLAGKRLRGDGTGVRRRATYMPGEIAMYGELTGDEHLAWFLKGRRRSALARARTIANELGLPLDRAVRGYSHGMKRQLLFSSALAPEVPLRILDEPTEGLDPTKRRQVLDLLTEDAAQGTTILLSSHHLGEVERACDRVLFLKDGTLFDEDETRRVRERASRIVRLGFAPDVDLQRVEELLLLQGVEILRVGNGEASVLLGDGSSPKSELRHLLDSADLPEPRSLVYGELSLQELYRELYGEEGV